MKTLDCSKLGFIMHIKKTAEQTQGASLEMEWEVMPNSGGTPVHIHPEAAETYKIMEGELEVYIDGKWQTAVEGDTVKVEKGVPHTFRNSSGRITRVYNTHQPAMEFENFFEDLAIIANSGVVNKRMTFKALLHLSVLWTKYRNEIKSVQPPYFVMLILGRLGRIAGIKY